MAFFSPGVRLGENTELGSRGPQHGAISTATSFCVKVSQPRWGAGEAPTHLVTARGVSPPPSRLRSRHLEVLPHGPGWAWPLSWGQYPMPQEPRKLRCPCEQHLQRQAILLHLPSKITRWQALSIISVGVLIA